VSGFPTNIYEGNWESRIVARMPKRILHAPSAVSTTLAKVNAYLDAGQQMIGIRTETRSEVGASTIKDYAPGAPAGRRDAASDCGL